MNKKRKQCWISFSKYGHGPASSCLDFKFDLIICILTKILYGYWALKALDAWESKTIRERKEIWVCVGINKKLRLDKEPVRGNKDESRSHPHMLSKKKTSLSEG